MPPKPEDRVSSRLDTIEAQGVNIISDQEGQDGDGKVLLGRLDTGLPKEDAIEQATRELFRHLTGREYKRPQK